MPYFVVIRAMERPATFWLGYWHNIDVRVLHKPFATLAEAEDVARRQAEFEQEYPWTTVYVVEAPHWRRAQHLLDPNDEYHHLHDEIVEGALADPEGRMPEQTERRSAYQPPKTRAGPPAPSALPPAALSDPAVQRALDAFATAGFEAVVHDHSPYFEDRPQYLATAAAEQRLRADVERMGGYDAVSAQQRQDLLFRTPDDVYWVGQRYDLYERGGEYRIGELFVYEFQTAELLDAHIRNYEMRMQRWSPRQTPPTDDLKRSMRFRTERVDFGFVLYESLDRRLIRDLRTGAIAALEPVLGPETFVG